jgi:hypothetical protein
VSAKATKTQSDARPAEVIQRIAKLLILGKRTVNAVAVRGLTVCPSCISGVLSVLHKRRRADAVWTLIAINVLSTRPWAGTATAPRAAALFRARGLLL